MQHFRPPFSDHDADREEQRPTVSIFWLKRALCPHRFGDKRLQSYITLLIEEKGFPPPLPALVTRRRTGKGVKRAADSLAEQVTMNSRWRRAAVEAWLEDFLPPDNAAAVQARSARAAASDMDSAASHLRLVDGGRA